MKIREYEVDSNLGYLIQQVTGDTTQEVLSYLFRVAHFALLNISSTTKSRYFEKTIVLHYKDTPITYAIKLMCGGNPNKPEANIQVKFPRKMKQYNVKDLMDSIVESGLELTNEEDMAAFDRPVLKVPKCLRQVKVAQDEQRTKVTAVKPVRDT